MDTMDYPIKTRLHVCVWGRVVFTNLNTLNNKLYKTWINSNQLRLLTSN